ncbi:MAG: isocitrate/isopropylmalate family dehydrogenase [Intestinimonas sp.]
MDVLLGGCATDAVGKSYPDGTAEVCRACDAVLLGAVGGPKWGSDKPAEQRPETALLAIRKDLGLYANLRPATLRSAMAGACPLKKETAEKGIDLMMVRELTGGVYFGKRTGIRQRTGAWNVPIMAYSEERIQAHWAPRLGYSPPPPRQGLFGRQRPAWQVLHAWHSVMHRLAGSIRRRV